MGMEKYKELFSSECSERLDRMAAITVEMEKEPGNHDMIAELFRHAHSIKGMSATMGYQNMSKLAHNLENLFDKLRNDEIKAQSSVIDVILRGEKALRSMLEEISAKGTNDEVDQNVMDDIESCAAGETVQRTPDPVVQSSVNTIKISPFVKVRTNYLDKLVDVVSELLSLKWKISNFKENNLKDGLEEEIEIFERLIKELEEKVLAMRLMPISFLTERLPVMVRDIARALGKSIDLEITGESIELDKNIIEALESPVVHLIRNCIDHGVESDVEREGFGKSPTGNIFFKAYRYRNRVILEVGDDGRGIDADMVAKKAIDMGLAKQSDIAVMSEEKKLLLTCLSGLSTSSTVGEISGRGVGMDVVKSSVEALGGNLSIYSQFNLGTTFKIDLPLTSAIIKVFMVESGGVLYGVPASEIESVIQLENEKIIGDGKMFKYVLPDAGNGGSPMYNLGTLLFKDKQDGKQRSRNAIVIKSGEERKVIAVDAFHGIGEVIVKPLSTVLKYIGGISGVTILPIGRPMFILNILELV